MHKPKLIVIYKRLDKPRGGWRYPLELSMGIEADEELALNPSKRFEYQCNFAWRDDSRLLSDERQVLASTHCFPLTARAERGGDGDNYISNIWVNSDTCTQTVYCLSKEIREDLINLLCEARTEWASQLQAWWDENAPEDGDATETHWEFTPSDSAQEKPERVIRGRRAASASA